MWCTGFVSDFILKQKQIAEQPYLVLNARNVQNKILKVKFTYITFTYIFLIYES